MTDYWAPVQHRVGDRVRIRLSRECPNVVPPLEDGAPNPCVIQHPPELHGHEGHITRYDAEWEPHPWRVAYVKPGHRYVTAVTHFAAVELVPLAEAAP